MIQETYVTFEQAKALKELGFPQDDVETNKFYTKPKCKMYGIDEHGRFYPCVNISKHLYTIGKYAVDKVSNSFLAPHLSLVQKWLREEKGLILLILVSEKGSYYPWGDMYVHLDYYDTYEEALSAGIDKCIDLLKENERKDSTESN